MNECSFEKLLQLLEKKLSTNAQLKVFDHLDKCEICRETIYHIARDRDEALRILLPQGALKKSRSTPQIGARTSVLAPFSKSQGIAARPPATGTLG